MDPFIESLKACLPAVESLGWEHGVAQEAGCPYISAARAKVIRRAINGGAEVLVFLDHDVSWTPEDMVKLLETEGDVVAGTYRKKTSQDEEIYMGVLDTDIKGALMGRADGCLKAHRVPAGFLKVSVDAINAFAKFYPELLFGPPMSQELDMFNHGVIEGIWYGEDYAFSKRWLDMGGDIWIIPDLDIDHHSADGTVHKGNLHRYLLKYNEEKESENAGADQQNQ